MELEFQRQPPRNLSGQLLCELLYYKSLYIELFTAILYHLSKPRKGSVTRYKTNIHKNPINYKLKVSGVRRVTFINVDINYKLKVSVSPRVIKIVATMRQSIYISRSILQNRSRSLYIASLAAVDVASES